MGIQIITGGGAAQFGAGMGAGLNQGLDAAQVKREKEQQAADYQQALDMLVLPEIERLDAQTPDEFALPPTTQVSAGKFGSFEVPSYMRPMPNPEQAQVDALSDMYAKGSAAIQDPEAKKLFMQGAIGQLDKLNQARVQRKLMSGLKAAQASGLLDESDVAMIGSLAESGGTPEQVYQAFDEVRQERIREQTNIRRTTRLVEANRLQEASMRQTADTIVDADEKQWASQQANRLAAKIDEIEVALMAGLEDFDFEDAIKQLDEIKYAFNPYQQAKIDEREMLLRMGYEARERVRVNTNLSDAEKEAAIKAINEEYGLTPQELPVPAPGAEDPATPEGEVETASARSTKGMSPEQMQMNEAKRAVISQFDGVDFAGLKPDEVDGRLTDYLARLADSLTGGEGVTVEMNDGKPDSEVWADKLFEVLQGVAEQDPQYAQLLAGRVVRMIDMADEAKAPKPEPRRRYDDDIGGAAWGGG